MRAGIFDSGVGGLSVAAALHRMRPSLPLIYVADTACFPYGERSMEHVADRAVLLARWLVEQRVEVIVVACNTASSAALEHLRETFDVPVVGMEPPVKPAIERSRTRHVAVLATAGTASGQRLARLTQTYGRGARVFTLPMPGLADLVEAGEAGGDRVEAMLREALAMPLSAGVDAVALGCTHYGFLRPALTRILPPGIEIVDAAEPVARRALWVLDEATADSQRSEAPDDAATSEVHCYATGDPASFRATIDRLAGHGADLPPLHMAGRADVGSLAGSGAGGGA